MKKRVLYAIIALFGAAAVFGCSRAEETNSPDPASKKKPTAREDKDPRASRGTGKTDPRARASDTAPASRTKGKGKKGKKGKAPLPKILPIKAKAPKRDVKKAAESINAFSGSIWQAMGSDEKNAFASPWSMVMALGMTYGGAKKGTAKEMAKVLKLRLPQSKLHAAHGAMISALRGTMKKDHYDLVVANSIWPHKNFKIKPPFVKLLKENYGIGIRRLDYENSPSKNARIINEWVEHWTDGMVKNLLKPINVRKLTRLVLVNTIYFKGDWVKPFKKQYTKPQPFHLTDGQKVKVPMMSQTSRFELSETKTYRTLRLPYKGGRMAMDVILPTKKGTIKAVEKELASKGFKSPLFGRGKEKVMLSLPRFKMGRRVKLAKVLASMGMKSAFDRTKADFTGITPPIKEGFYIGKVIHKAVCEVDERGTKAAAATAVVMTKGAGAPTRPKVFRVDRPFMMVIRDTETNVVLFVGRVMNPKAK